MISSLLASPSGEASRLRSKTPTPFQLPQLLVYILYLDESGNPERDDCYFVLAGICPVRANPRRTGFSKQDLDRICKKSSSRGSTNYPSSMRHTSDDLTTQSQSRHIDTLVADPAPQDAFLTADLSGTISQANREPRLLPLVLSTKECHRRIPTFYDRRVPRSSQHRFDLNASAYVQPGVEGAMRNGVWLFWPRLAKYRNQHHLRLLHERVWNRRSLAGASYRNYGRHSHTSHWLSSQLVYCFNLPISPRMRVLRTLRSVESYQALQRPICSIRFDRG